MASGVPASSSAWKRDLDEVRGCCPAAFSPFERAPVDQHPQDLLDEERVSLGPLENACTRLVPNLVDVQQLVDEPAGLPSTEWLQVESGCVVGLEHARMALGDLRERPVRDPVPVREASPFQKTDVASEPIDQLGEKAALPHAA